MDFLTTAGAFIVVLGVIIFVHESGHFITAKAFGMRVFIFSFGFGRRLFGFKWGDTDCRVSLIPLGGYVKLEGEPDDRLSEDTSGLGDRRDFTSRPRWQRFIVYIAGPIMNAALTVGVLTVLFMVGSEVDATFEDRPIVGAVEPGSPAEEAGLKPGDEILAIDGRPLATWGEAQYAILLRPDTALAMRVRRGVEELELRVLSRSKSAERVGHIGVAPLVRIGSLVPGHPAEAAGLRRDDAILRIGERPVPAFEEIPAILASSGGKPVRFQIYREGGVFEVAITPKDGRVGIRQKTVVKRFGLAGAVSESVQFSWRMTRLTFETIGRLLTGRISIRTLSGPLGIARESGDAARQGPRRLFMLVAMISLQVGLLNLFPLAPLDGGHLAILMTEGLLRRDFSAPVKAWIMNAGAALIFLLIGLVLYSDLSKTGWFGRLLP